MLKNDPEYLNRLMDAERQAGRTFFPPDYIPKKYQTGRDDASGKTICTSEDVARYLTEQKETLFNHEEEHRSCMSYYSICE